MMQLIEERIPSFPSLYDAYHSCLGKSPFTCRNPESLRVSLPSFLRKQEEDDRYYWRTDLKATEPHWQGWFQGLSDVFLGECRVPKLLVLAGTDRLDTPLTIGQMQGKFQMRVLPWVGHVVQEDAPDITAQAVQEFVDRYLR
jgi:protein phosphatase methylesterase 1